MENQENKIDYDKHYDGIEILQLIKNNVLKENDVIEYNYNGNIDNIIKKMYIDHFKILRFCENKNEIPCSYIMTANGDDSYFTIIKPQKPLTFQEALDKKYDYKLFKIKHKKVDKSLSDNYMRFDVIIRAISEEYDDISLREILNEAEFYIKD